MDTHTLVETEWRRGVVAALNWVLIGGNSPVVQLRLLQEALTPEALGPTRQAPGPRPKDQRACL